MEIVNLSRDVDAILHKRTKSESRYDALAAELLIDLLYAMRCNSEDHQIYVSLLVERELWLQYVVPSGASCLITVTIDRPDFEPLEDGRPRFHYRMAYRITRHNDGHVGSLIESRVHSTGLAVEFVQTAISETQNAQ